MIPKEFVFQELFGLLNQRKLIGQCWKAAGRQRFWHSPGQFMEGWNMQIGRAHV